jgi:hypothetical protein
VIDAIDREPGLRAVRRVEDITEALWGKRVSPSTVSDLNKKIYGTIEAWRNRPIEGEHPYVYLDRIVLKRSWAGKVRNVSLLSTANPASPRASASPPHSSAPERGKRKAGGARGNVSFAESQPRNQQIEVRPSTGCLRALAVSLSFD